MILRVVAAVAAAVALHAAAAMPVAFVADVSGAATIAGDGPLDFLAELEPGTRLFLGSGAHAAITFARSGREYTATGPGEFVVAAEDLQAERGTAPVRREVPALGDAALVARVSRSATASLRMRGVHPQAASSESALEYPVDTKVATLQPMLRWNAADGARDAKVTLRDEAGRDVWSGKTSGATIRPAVKLSAATRYTWTVMSSRGVVGEARFETLAAQPLSRVEASRASARSFSERVMHVLLLQELGAAQDAKSAWGELARERPDLPQLARLAR
jgi:hypothetical protein